MFVIICVSMSKIVYKFGILLIVANFYDFITGNVHAEIHSIGRLHSFTTDSINTNAQQTDGSTNQDAEEPSTSSTSPSNHGTNVTFE